MSDRAIEQFFNTVASGHVNTPEEWHAYLEAFHAAFPHANELFTLLRALSDVTSYDVLAVEAVGSGAITILDVGCGDGNLIEAMLDILPARGRIDGIDSSEAEIAIAQRRYGHDHRVALTVGDARALPYANGAFDCVVAHQFFNLFPAIHPLIDEVARVLKPGGDLMFMANRSLRGDTKSHWLLLHEAAMAALKELYPNLVWPRMGDMRFYSAEGIPEILAESDRWDMSTLTMASFDTRATMKPGHIAAIYNRLYLFATVPEKQRILAAVERRAQEIVSDNDASVEISLPFRLVKIKTRPI